ncbi:helix-turn-helix domain-containing protein [Mycobacteroides salmoniphilum]|uniref:helix-turn-helix transcriptional regulator n=1 Tax=Mycobacteroides salmoniphilum TaxID=404941 RepID=UPI00356AC8E9
MTTAYDGGRVPEIVLRHRLLIARIESGLSQAALAQRVGISRQTVSNTENGTTTPRRIVVNAWALATGFSVKWLLGELGNDPDGGGSEWCARRDSNPQPSDP